MGKQVAPLQSLLLNSLLFLFVLSASQFWAGDLAASEVMTIVGGFVCSLCFATLFLAISNAEQLLLGEGVTVGWIEAIVAELVALVVALTIHRVCVTTCFLFSLGVLYALNRQSFVIHGAAVDELTATVGKGKKKAK